MARSFRAGGAARARLGLVSSLGALDDLLAELDPSEPYPRAELGTPRGRQGGPKRVVLPEGWLDDARYARLDANAELATSGG